ncbi:U2 small nuclear ribonucleoprotein B'' [Thelohanellus kitauei]|uniref:U2 small nuclear ribonucleoprotein B n=1 Tax=Thelohanellus kitauei TaxID=669202 RepID=A0A0C2IQJ3_THEKT|nr:U2 small nuclear ribonucleoprotein B'' [Thelohanellus kitauei]
MIPILPELPPSQTLYLSNLNEKVRLDELKRALYDTFSPYGPIVDINAKKSLKMKGQAFVVFKDIDNACVAHRAMQSFIFYNKPMRVQFAKKKSDAIAKMDGTYVPRERGPYVEGPRKRKTAPRSPTAPKVQKVVDQPNSILFLQNLPEQANLNTLTVLFGQLPGFKEVRMVPNRKEVAFVEYESEAHASSAKESLQGFKITATHPLRIHYAKR